MHQILRLHLLSIHSKLIGCARVEYYVTAGKPTERGREIRREKYIAIELGDNCNVVKSNT